MAIAFPRDFVQYRLELRGGAGPLRGELPSTLLGFLELGLDALEPVEGTVQRRIGAVVQCLVSHDPLPRDRLPFFASACPVRACTSGDL